VVEPAETIARETLALTEERLKTTLVERDDRGRISKLTHVDDEAPPPREAPAPAPRETEDPRVVAWQARIDQLAREWLVSRAQALVNERPARRSRPASSGVLSNRAHALPERRVRIGAPRPGQIHDLITEE